MTKGSDNPFPSVLVAEQGSAPTTPSSGYGRIYCKSNGLYFIGDNGVEIGPLAAAVGSIINDYICIQDQKAQNTSGGTFTAGAWQTRDLNTEVSDTGNHASVAANQITLAAGTYTCRIRCPAYEVNDNQAKLYNVTDAADILLGSSEYFNTTDAVTGASYVCGKFTLAAQKVLEVRHYCGSTKATIGFGVQANHATEIYTSAEFWKVG